MKRVGILALQGAFAVHAGPLRALGHQPVEVRSPQDLVGSDGPVDGLILPGGESSVHLTLIERFGLTDPLLAFARSGRPVMATCAGLILAARAVVRPAQRSFGLLDIAVVRNGYGRQRHSFEAVADGGGELPLVFIRAPRITEVGARVDVLATFRGEPILVRQGNVLGAAFHPELTEDLRVHQAVFGRA